MSRYTKEHYEDVAGLLRATKEKFGRARVESKDIIGTLAYSFAILFAADNPPVYDCPECAGSEDRLVGGFDREQFLTACGLEPARPYSTSMFRPKGDF